MDTDPVLERVCRLIERELDLDPGEVGPQTTRDGCRYWDSLAHLRLCMALEGEFGTRFSSTDLHSLSSVSDILEALRRD